jgi:NADH-quinone oxidoreductase subunit M
VNQTSSILTWLILLPAIGALLILCIPSGKIKLLRNTALTITLLTCVLSCVAAGLFNWNIGGDYGSNLQLMQRHPWIPSLNIHYFVGVDGLSLPMVLLTTGIAVLACLASFSIDKQVKGYFVLFLLLLSGMIGVFVSLDLILFYVFFEVSLFPMYFLIGIFGGPRKEYAAIKFFLYTLLGSICLLVVILGIYFNTQAVIPGGSFDLIQLATNPSLTAIFKAGSGAAFAGAAFWLLFAGFAVKLPTVPFHTWLPDAHVEAPTPVSMILAAVLLKMGGYGLLRVAYAIFPQQAVRYWWWVALIGVVSIVYGALCAMGQKDFKRLVAYSSISHMGYVVLGIAVLTPAGMSGAVYQMLAHGVSSAMMFYIVGVIYERAHHRDLDKLGGLGTQMPAFMGLAMIGFFASMGLPGLCGFIGELLVMLGNFGAADPNSIVSHASGNAATTSLMIFGILAAATLALTAGYLLWAVQRIFFGASRPEFNNVAPLRGREKFILSVLAIFALTMGLVPWVILDPIRASLDALLRLAS